MKRLTIGKMKSEAEITIAILKKLETSLGQVLSPALRESQLLVDLSDIHEISRSYIKLIEQLVEADPVNVSTIEDILYKIDTEILEHLPYHAESLKALFPKLLDAVDEKTSALKLP